MSAVTTRSMSSRKEGEKLAENSREEEKKVAENSRKEEKKVAENSRKEEKKVAENERKEEKKVAENSRKDEKNVAENSGKEEKQVADNSGKEVKKVAENSRKDEKKVAENSGKDEKKVAVNSMKDKKKVAENKEELHCVRCHDTFDGRKNTLKACIVEHDLDTFDGCRGGTNWYRGYLGCCGAFSKFHRHYDDEKTSPKFCYSGRHTTDPEEVEYNDSTIATCSLKSCGEALSSASKAAYQLQKERQAREDAQAGGDDGWDSSGSEFPPLYQNPKRKRKMKTKEKKGGAGK